MLPELILNWIASTALVVLKYPATKPLILKSDAWYSLKSDVKCLTKTVELGLYNVKEPEMHSSLPLPRALPSEKAIKSVDCAKSCDVFP